MKIVENIIEKSYFPMIKYALYKNFEIRSLTDFDKYMPYEGNIPMKDEILYLFQKQKMFEINFFALEEDYSYKLKKKEELESIAVLSVFNNSLEWIEKYILPLYFILFEENFIDVLIECAIDNEYHEMFVLLIEFKRKYNLYKKRTGSCNMTEKEYQAVMHELKTFEGETGECKYCRKENPERIMELHANFPEYRLTVIGNMFDDYFIDFKFCPMCGREL